MREGVVSYRAAMEVKIRPSFRDLESDEAVLALYHRWCCHYEICRTPAERAMRLGIFLKNAFHAFEMNKMDKMDPSVPSCEFHLSSSCDEKDLFDPSGVEEMTLTPTKEDMESDEALWDLYRRWRDHHKIHRTPEEMKWAFRSFKKSATYAFDMSQKDPTVQFCLSIWCDETDICLHQVKIIPTERDLKSGNALLGLYHRYCRAYRTKLCPNEMKQRFYDFKKSVYHVFEKNKRDPFHLCRLSSCCDEKDIMPDKAAATICIMPTFRDLGSDEAVMALYPRWCLKLNTPRTSEEMGQRFDIFKKIAQKVFEANIERPGTQGLIVKCDGFY